MANERAGEQRRTRGEKKMQTNWSNLFIRFFIVMLLQILVKLIIAWFHVVCYHRSNPWACTHAAHACFYVYVCVCVLMFRWCNNAWSMLWSYGVRRPRRWWRCSAMIWKHCVNIRMMRLECHSPGTRTHRITTNRYLLGHGTEMRHESNRTLMDMYTLF